MTPIEVRKNDDGSLDEVCARGCTFHLEQMDNCLWWMGVEMPDGSSVHVWLRSRGKITANFEVDGVMEKLPTGGP